MMRRRESGNEHRQGPDLPVLLGEQGNERAIRAERGHWPTGHTAGHPRTTPRQTARPPKLDRMRIGGTGGGNIQITRVAISRIRIGGAASDYIRAIRLQIGTAKNGTAHSGTARSHTCHSGTAQRGNSHNNTARSRTARSRTARRRTGTARRASRGGWNSPGWQPSAVRHQTDFLGCEVAALKCRRGGIG